VCAVLFVVSYFTLEIGEVTTTFAGLGASTVALGLTLSGALLFIGIGVIQWARKLMSDHEIVEMRHPIASSETDREETLAMVATGVEESGIGRRPLVRNSLLGALGLLALPVPVVLLRDLGPLPGNALYTTVWTEGMRVVRDVVGTPIKASELQIGDLVNAEPAAMFETDDEGEPLVEGVDLQVMKSKAAVILVRMEPDEIVPNPERVDWDVDGIVCYSKICTHVGCPISLYERTTHHVLCPCHQSTFDLADSGKVMFGPAARPLPQLPLMVDGEGYLVAQSGFNEPVGPSFWERNS
jgi:ubiquinol-cytochrome c reductase iron-sulfur subunit